MTVDSDDVDVTVKINVGDCDCGGSSGCGDDVGVWKLAAFIVLVNDDFV